MIKCHQYSIVDIAYCGLSLTMEFQLLTEKHLPITIHEIQILPNSDAVNFKIRDVMTIV